MRLGGCRDPLAARGRRGRGGDGARRRGGRLAAAPARRRRPTRCRSTRATTSTPAELERAEDYRDGQRCLLIAGLAIEGAVLARAGARAPGAGPRRGSSGSARRPLAGAAAAGAGIALLGRAGHPADRARSPTSAPSTSASRPSRSGPWLWDVAPLGRRSRRCSPRGGAALLIALVRRFPRAWWLPGAALRRRRSRPSSPGSRRSSWRRSSTASSRCPRAAGRAPRCSGSASGPGSTSARSTASTPAAGSTSLNAYVDGLGSDQAGRPLRQPARRRRARRAATRSSPTSSATSPHDDIPRGLAFVAIVAPLGLLFVRELGTALARRAGADPGDAGRGPGLPARARARRPVLNVPGNQLSREVEASADTFALELTGDPQALIDLQLRLARTTSPTPTRRALRDPVRHPPADGRADRRGAGLRARNRRGSARSASRLGREPRGRASRSCSAVQPSSSRGAGRVDRDPLHLAGAAGASSGSNSRPAGGGDPRAELEHARLDPGADVVGPVAAALGGGEERRDDVADVDVVAGLLAVAEDARPRAAEQGAGEDRDHAGLAVRVLARPVDVAEAQRDGARGRRGGVEAEVALGGELRLPVGRVGAALGVLGERQLAALALAVDRPAGRGEDEARRPASARARSSRLIVPPTLTSRSKRGSATERRTSICAARWKTARAGARPNARRRRRRR